MTQDFEFVQDQKFKRILNRDYLEIKNCLEAKAFKSVLVLSGAIIEAVLLEFLTNNPPKNYTKTKINNLKFIDLIDLSMEINLISKTTKDLSSVVREYRNHIHPNKEIRSETEINEDNANIAYRLVNLVINNVKENHPKLYGNKAEDVFSKLHSDPHSKKIFDSYLKRMNQNEKDLLYQKFISFYLQKDDVDYSDQSFVKFGMEKLNNHTSEHIINTYIFQIEKEVLNGSQKQAEKLFELFGEKISLYNEDSIDTILIYLYSCLGTCRSYNINSNIYYYSSKGIINKMNIYLNPNKNYYNTHLYIMKSIVENLAELKFDSDKWDTRRAFLDLKEGISEIEYNRFINQESLKPYIESFFSILNDPELLPF